MGRRRRLWPVGMIAGIAVLTVPLALLLNRDAKEPVPAPGELNTLQARNHHAAAIERKHKQRILTNDVAATEALCRRQCRVDLEKLAGNLKKNGKTQATKSLVAESIAELRRKRPHMHTIAWLPAGKEGQTVQIGSIDNGSPGMKEAWKQAKLAVSQGKKYESDAIKSEDGSTYFVIGVPADNGDGGSLISLVHQDVLQHVERHQSRNLRLQQFPDEEKRFGIRAVDPKTGQEVDVDSAEENEGISHYRKGEVVVRFQSDPSEAELSHILEDIGTASVKKLGFAYVFDSKRMSTQELLDYFEDKNIRYAEPHYLYVTNETANAATVPNDELYREYQWNLPMIKTETGWSLSKGTEEVLVAVIDTGADLAHPDLQNHLVQGYNVVDPDSPPNDDVGHGTHVTGVISALTNNGQGVAGMTWYNKVMPVKVLDSTGMGSTYSVAEGIIWAADHGAKVINMSLGNYASAQFLHDAIQYAFDKDVVMIAATGNDNTSQPGYPAAYPEVLAVSATNQYREKASFSNYGDYIDVVAPGENIASTYMNSQYAALSGTSMASPHVAALAALIRSANPALKNTEVYDMIRNSTVDLGPSGRDPYFGYGQINVSQALQLATGQQMPEAAADEESAGRTVGGGNWLQDILRALLGGR